MTIINVDCNLCGARNLVPADAMLAVASIPNLDTDFGGVVCWICTACEEAVLVPVVWPLFLRLIAAGVALIDEEPETDLPPHPERPRDNDTLTFDDLLDLHELLGTDYWFNALAANFA